jgi:CRP-like cAMP-binding protein
MDDASLSVLPVFAALSREEVTGLAAGADRLDIGAAGVELLQAGDFGHSALVVLEGTADVSVDGTFVRELSPGDLFGEIAVLSSGRRTATVTSRTPMVLASIFKRDLWAVEESNDAFAAELRRLRAAYQQI